jgi:hypothetical protein
LRLDWLCSVSKTLLSFIPSLFSCCLQFEKSANAIKDSVEFHTTGAVQTFESLADAITSEALTANASWPFFTSDNFEIEAAHARLNAFTEFVMFTPLVNARQRKDWEAYSLKHAADSLRQSKTLGQETINGF